MSQITTPDFLANEEEATYWLFIFEQLPDGFGASAQQQPSAFIIDKIKAFAQVYQPIVLMGKDDGFVIN